MQTTEGDSMPDRTPLISVIIPTYNRAHLLIRAINSALSQSYPNLEIIVVDDASTDDTERLVREMNSERVVYHKNAVNVGSQASRNTGLKMATGQFICFLDSDDELLPQKLELQYEMFRNSPSKVGVVCSDCFVLNETNNTLGEWHRELQGSVYREMLKTNSLIDFLSPLTRRQCFEKTGPLDENVLSYQEWDTFLTISKDFDFEYVPRKLAIYHIHAGDTISKDLKKAAAGYT